MKEKLINITFTESELDAFNHLVYMTCKAHEGREINKQLFQKEIDRLLSRSVENVLKRWKENDNC